MSTHLPPGSGPAGSPERVRTGGRGLVALDGALALIAVLLIVQMWLLTAALESDLAGHHEVVWPAAIISVVLFGGCAALYLFVHHVDKDVRSE